jgi:hypothetical protein
MKSMDPKNNLKSKCCNAPVRVECGEDFIGDIISEMEVATCWYVCTKCNKPCNVKGE